MVRQPDHAEPEAIPLEHHGRLRLLEAGARSDPGDPRRVGVLERVEQRLRPEVERVVVRELDAVDAEEGKRRDRIVSPARPSFTADSSPQSLRASAAAITSSSDSRAATVRMRDTVERSGATGVRVSGRPQGSSRIRRRVWRR
jgi:hypothetical protein